MTCVSLIAAIASNGVIGLNNTLPWHLPEDLKHFRALTMGHHIIMGRKTFESLGRLLPGRTTVIVSRNPDYRVDEAIVVPSLSDAVAACGNDSEVFVIGGAQLYREAIDIAERFYRTEIDAEPAGDTWFPPYDAARWRESARMPGVSANGLRYAFVTLERAPA